MDNSQSKFKFSSRKQTNENVEIKEKENYNMDELKKYYGDFITKYNSKHI